MSSYTLGCDLSHWQGSPDWGRVAAAGIKFAFLKASESQNSVDGSFDRSASEARANGISLIGAYHFADPTINDAVTEAKHYLDTIDRRGMLGAALDIETLGQYGSYSGLDNWCEEFLAEVERQSTYRVITYCSRSYAAGMWGVLFKGNRGIWLASPGTLPQTDWDFWQYTWTMRLPSIYGDVDGDYFHGTEAELGVYLRTREAPKPKPKPVPVPPPPHWDDHLPVYSATGFARLIAIGDPNPHKSVQHLATALVHQGCGPLDRIVADGRIRPALTSAWRHWQHKKGTVTDGHIHLAELVELAEIEKSFHAVR